eukprot:5129587-Amphidinium_carterae.1
MSLGDKKPCQGSVPVIIASSLPLFPTVYSIWYGAVHVATFVHVTETPQQPLLKSSGSSSGAQSTPDGTPILFQGQEPSDCCWTNVKEMPTSQGSSFCACDVCAFRVADRTAARTRLAVARSSTVSGEYHGWRLLHPQIIKPRWSVSQSLLWGKFESFAINPSSASGLRVMLTACT